MNIFKIEGYETSKDYALLASLARKQSVICICDYGSDCRDIAHTLSHSGNHGEYFEITARGIGYVGGSGEKEFVRLCELSHVEFLIPNAPADRERVSDTVGRNVGTPNREESTL